ncbi:MAG TPA: cyclic nucleotide-binding domain-containing protein [Chloroflexota bacterium]|nr:cyclic nucleotide-binding domain-containing protein [Chloroflexota bacterium]
METLERVIERHPFLQGLSHRYLLLLLGCASQARFNPGEFVFHMGENADNFYLIRHGKVALELYTAERGPLTIETLGDNEAVGWSWLVPPYRWNLDARAIQPTLTLSFDAACLRRKCEEDHDLGYEMYKRFTPVIAQRLQATRVQVLDVHRVHA